jgi:hypothetical protein
VYTQNNFQNYNPSLNQVSSLNMDANFNVNSGGYPSFGNNTFPVNSVNNGMSMTGNVQNVHNVQNVQNVQNVKKDPLEDLFG